jgi:hypothetical protein
VGLCARIWYAVKLGIDIVNMNINGNSNKAALPSILSKDTRLRNVHHHIFGMVIISDIRIAGLT